MQNLLKKQRGKLDYSTFNIRNSTFYSKGFSLLELLIVISIMATLSAAGVAFYRNMIKSVELQSVSKVLSSDLRSMRSKAMIGEGEVKWGAHVVSVSAGAPYYELFSTPTDYAAGTVTSTTTLPVGVTFSDPAPGASRDIIFSKISGTTTVTSLVLVSEDATRTINIVSIGTID